MSLPRRFDRRRYVIKSTDVTGATTLSYDFELPSNYRRSSQVAFLFEAGSSDPIPQLQLETENEIIIPMGSADLFRASTDAAIKDRFVPIELPTRQKLFLSFRFAAALNADMVIEATFFLDKEQMGGGAFSNLA